MSVSDMMDFLVSHQAKNLKPGVLADIFDRMIWILDDNGGEIQRIRAMWLQGEDAQKIEIALLMDEAFPFDTKAETERVFSRIVEKWPTLKGRCEIVLKQWDEQYPA